MCGIAGIIGLDASEEKLKELLKSIVHRGEDSHQYEIGEIEGVGFFGMHRLGIVDESQGMQPIVSADKKVQCVFNGEIYNYKSTRKILDENYHIDTQCDSEIVLYAYLYWGDDFVKYLDGMFAIAIFDATKNKLLLARDSLGIKPLYYSKEKGNIKFASEIKSLANDDDVKKILEIKPGTVWINDKSIRFYTLQNFSKSKENNSIGKFCQLKKCLTRVVAKHIPEMSYEIACLLSGGIDSSIVTLLASKFCPNIVAYTLAAPNTASEDIKSAKELCEKLNMKHVIVTPCIEEMKEFYLNFGVYMTESFETTLIRNAVSYYFLCAQVAKDGFKFCLNGEGADELFGGYDFVMEVPESIRDNMIWHSLSIIHKSYLQMADRASMFATLEARVPYMNEELVSYCLRLPADFRIVNNKNKASLREIFKEDLPLNILQRRKVGMNEGAGFGKNLPTDSIYCSAVKEYYAKDSAAYKDDLKECEIKKFEHNIYLDLDNLEEIYNFAKYSKLNYLKFEDGRDRLQLNTKLNVNFIPPNLFRT